MANQSSGKQPNTQVTTASLVPLSKPGALADENKTKFELRGVDQMEKKVTSCTRCGRIYLPLAWVGKRVKIIRMD